MRKMKKINGYLVVRFNDREKRGYPTLGSFGVIDAELYTGQIDIDFDAFDYNDADMIEVAVEQARGLDAEKDFSDEDPFYTVITETAEEVKEEEVEPTLLVNGMETKLKTQIKSKGFPYITPITAAHELVGYKTALYDLGLLGEDDMVTDLRHFGELCELQDDDGHHANVALLTPEGMALLSPHDYEEGETFTGCTVQTLKCRRCGHESFAWSKGPATVDEKFLGYVCDELCRFREGRTQEELDAICAKCRMGRWTADPPTLTPQEVRELRNLKGLLKGVEDYVNGEDKRSTPYQPRSKRPERTALHLHLNLQGIQTIQDLCDVLKLTDGVPDAEPSQENFQHSVEAWDSFLTRKVFQLGLMMEVGCPENDCTIYRNTFRMARELDKALDNVQEYAAEVLQRELGKHVRELQRMYHENYAVKEFRKGASL